MMRENNKGEGSKKELNQEPKKNLYKKQDEDLGIYIHVPFCFSKCIYCNFFSQGGGNSPSSKEKQRLFAQRIAKDVSLWKDYPATESHKVSSIYLGGGTPSMLEVKDLENIFHSIRNAFLIDEDGEITIEANPRTLTKEKLQGYKDLGVNRLSLGLQSTDDEILKRLGRGHRFHDFAREYALARELGFDNISLDLIFGLPWQSLDSWEKELGKTLDFKPEHLSLYSLQLEEGTALFNMFEKGLYKEVSDKVNRKMYHHAIEILADGGYNQYEISNFARNGRESRHNLRYWTFKPYISFGPSGASFLENIRWVNSLVPSSNGIDRKQMVKDIDLQDIIKRQNWKGEDVHINSHFDNMSEYTFTGLRLTKGIEYRDFESRFGMRFWEAFPMARDELKVFFARGFIREDGNRLWLTTTGFDVSNEILTSFV